MVANATVLVAVWSPDPATCANIGVLQAVRELMRYLSQSQQGLLFLISQPETTNLLLRLVTPLTHLTPLHPLTWLH